MPPIIFFAVKTLLVEFLVVLFYLRGMKTKLLAAAPFFAALTILSCGDNNKDQNQTTDQPFVLPSTLNQTQQTDSAGNPINKTIDMQPVKSGELTTSANVKLNPEHGQPGHRCDLGVGEPLPGTVQPTANVQPNTQPVTINTQPATQTTGKSSGKLNPEHGQPGHRCEIAVGAPLDGSVTPTTTTNTQTTPITVNTTPQNNSNTSNTNAKLNPAHGQPGHRCDIAVGAPLDGSTAAKPTVQTTDVKSPLQYFPTTQKVDPNTSRALTVDAKKDSGKKN